MRPQELNLLMVFDAVMTEGSITRAAERLAMTQPAVSNAVSRMRVAWKDELFVKDGRNIQPTLFARDLWRQVQDPLQQLGNAIDPEAFDPATADRTFRIGAGDGVVDVAWKPLRMLIEREAPNLAIHAFPYNIVNGERILNDAMADLLLAPMVLMPNLTTSEFLYESHYYCVMRPGHPLAKAGLSLEEFAAADHLLVSPSGDATGFTDHSLAQHDLSRRIAMTVNHFSAAPEILAVTDLISVLPSITVEEEIMTGKLAITCVPLEIPPTRVGCFWHRRQERDTGLKWLRAQLTDILKKDAAEHEEVMKNKLCR